MPAQTWSALVTAAATEIAAALPLPDGWPAKGRAWPHQDTGRWLRKAGWPSVKAVLTLPGGGGRVASADQTVVCYPLPWLVELVRRIGVPAKQVIHGRVEDD